MNEKQRQNQRQNQKQEEKIEIETKRERTWCPGCTNYAVLSAYAKALKELIEEGKIERKKVVVVSGIGCHGKVHDYLNVTSINALHGRLLPVMLGIKIARPDVVVIGVSGDGDCYNEGIEHLIHFARYNVNATLVVHNNQVFSLTAGQPTATTQKGFASKTLNKALADEPLNPIKLMLSLDTGFVARCYALDIEHTKEVLKEAIMHRGFSFVEVLQPCIVFNDTREFMGKRLVKSNSAKDAVSWDYTFDENARIAIGIFNKKQKPTFEEKYLQLDSLGQ